MLKWLKSLFFTEPPRPWELTRLIPVGFSDKETQYVLCRVTTTQGEIPTYLDHDGYWDMRQHAALFDDPQDALCWALENFRGEKIYSFYRMPEAHKYWADQASNLRAEKKQREEAMDAVKGEF